VQGVRDRLLGVADELYARVGTGVAGLPLASRPGINAARLLYAAIGHEARRGGVASLARRASVPRGVRALLLVRAAVTLRPRTGLRDAPPLPANEPLLAAVAAHPGRPVLPSRAEFVIDLFERLGRAEGIGERAA
jgi:phytoene synthase